MVKQKRYLLDFDDEIDYDVIGICSHHNDYRLAWSINSSLGFHLEQSPVPYIITTTKKGIITHQPHPMFEYYEEENRVSYYLIKNKEAGKFLIQEKPTIDFFLFIHRNNVVDQNEVIEKLRKVNSILAVFKLDVDLLPSTENILF